jgi:hypothetical protein
MRCRPHHQELDTILPKRVQDAYAEFFKLRPEHQQLQLHEQTKLQVIAEQEE